jgi:hypothetical protein
MVAACNRVLRAGPVTDQDRDDLEAELARHDGPDGFIRALKRERAFGISSYAPMKNSRRGMGYPGSRTTTKANLGAKPRGLKNGSAYLA